MNKRTRVKKWLVEHPDVVVYSTVLVAAAGVLAWSSHASKSAIAGPFPLATGIDFDKEKDIIRVFEFLSDKSIKTYAWGNVTPPEVL